MCARVQLCTLISGRIAIDAAGETDECETGTLVTFDPGGRHALQRSTTRGYCSCSWPAAGHKAAEPAVQHLPANPTSEPIDGPPTDDDASTSYRRRGV
jgi:hypothetical protein